MQLPSEPSIVVLLVATDGAQWLPDVIRGLRAQKYGSLDVLAVDNASTDGSSAILTKAFGARRVVTLERRVGYGRALAAALKVASDRSIGGDAFLLVHDDAALAQRALRSLIDAMRAHDAGIVGAKLLEWHDTSQLQDVGQTTDRYGRSVPRVERGEIDQGQHEGVHDVLYATSAVLLIAREVLERVGLFDLRYVAMRDDLDLCWRARLAGYRTVVTTKAAARHVSAGSRELRASPMRGRVRYFAERNMIATLIKNYSLLRLTIALPMTLMISIFNSLLFFLTGRRRAAGQVLDAVQWNIIHLPSTLRGRARAQRTRKVGDGTVSALMHHGATRLRSQFERAVERVIGEVEEASEDDLDRPPPRVIDRVRAHPAAALVALSLLLAVIGARTVVFSGGLAGRGLAPFPASGHSFFAEFASGWRGPAAGGAAPTTPGMVLLGIITSLTFGSGWIAERTLVLGLPFLAALSMYRLTRVMQLSPAGRRLAVTAYGFSPLVLIAFGEGRFADMVLMAAAPLLLIPLLRAAGVLPEASWRSTAAAIACLAIATSLAPWSLVLFAGTGLVLGIITAPSPKASTARVLARTAVVSAGALALLLPWSVELFKPGSPIGSGRVAEGARMVEALGLAPAGTHPVPLALSFGIIVSALTGLAAAAPERRRIAGLLAGLSAVGLFLAWAVARGVPWIAPRPALPLVVTAVCWTLLGAFAIDAARPLLTARTFGGAQVLAGIAGALLIVQIGAGAFWVARGTHPGLMEAGSIAPTFLADEAVRRGAFRVAWVGGSVRRPNVALTGPRGETMLSFLARPSGSGARALERSIAAILGGSTEAGGRLLATLGVRYVIVRPGSDAALSDAMGRQVDLAFSQQFHGATVFENEVGLPVAASVSSPGWVSGSSGGLASAAGAEASPVAGPGFQQKARTTFEGTVRARAQELLLAEDFSPEWRAQVGAKSLQPRRSFGWATRFALPAAGRDVRIDWSGQKWHRAALVFEAVIVFAFATWSSQRRARERGER